MRKFIEWGANPILVKELRSRMRGGRAFATLTGVLLLLAIFSFILYRVSLVAMQYSGTPLSPQVGQIMFAGLAFFELIMICAIAPAVTAGSISGEKEKLTYEMLITTPLRPVSVLWGKLISALSYVFLLIFAAVPMASLVFIFGGVSLRDMLKTLIMLAVMAVMFGVIGLFMSAMFGRTGRATAITYVVVLLMMFGPLFLAAMSGILHQTDPPRWMLIPSPISALASSMSPSVNPQILSNTFWMLGSTYWVMGAPQISLTSIPRPLYHYSLPIYLLVTIILYMITTRLVLPTRRWLIHWSDVLIAFIVMLGLFGFVGVGYVATANRYEDIEVVMPTLAPTMSPGMAETAVPITIPDNGSVPATGAPLPEIMTPIPGIEPIPSETPTPYPPPKGEQLESYFLTG
jgi:ABC-2 type transport system permease protein